MSTLRSLRVLTPRTLAVGVGLAVLTLAAATPAAAQYRTYGPPAPAYASYGSYGQTYGRADTRVVVTYGQPSPYDYGYSYPRTGAAGAVYEGETRVYAAAGADQGDQQRVATPSEALKAGATHLVVARPVVAAESPSMAAARIAAEMLEIA